MVGNTVLLTEAVRLARGRVKCNVSRFVQGISYAEAAKKVPGNVTMVRQMVTIIHVKNEVK